MMLNFSVVLFGVLPNFSKLNNMNTILIILFTQFMSAFTCAVLHLIFYAGGQDFPLIVYRIMAGMTFFGTMLALYVVMPVLVLFGCC